MASALGTKPAPGCQPPAQSSMKQNTAVGSGSRPGSGSVKIDTSAPTECHTLGRAPGGWLR